METGSPDWVLLSLSVIVFGCMGALLVIAAYRQWVHPKPYNPRAVPVGGHLHEAASSDRPGVWIITPIANGFMLTRKEYNPGGPDFIYAIHAGTPQELADTLVAQLVTDKLKG